MVGWRFLYEREDFWLVVVYIVTYFTGAEFFCDLVGDYGWSGREIYASAACHHEAARHEIGSPAVEFHSASCSKWQLRLGFCVRGVFLYFRYRK